MSSIYDKPFKYNKKADAYVVVVHKPAKDRLGVYDVTLTHGDRALPHGFIHKTANRQLYTTYLFQPGHHDYDHSFHVGQSATLQEAIDDVRTAWEKYA
jgi:hypothetical protein